MEKNPSLTGLYGSKVFKEAVIRQRLSKKVYESFLKTIELGNTLDVSIAPDVARAMMSWAIENGATHYAHWFLPMTDITACKHDSFYIPTSIGEASLEFPSSTLVKGEPDASSFPSGGLRATFEARGYTTWDPTSPAFVHDGTLFIPSVFVSYNGEALDRKLPLLRSLEAINKHGLRLLKFFKLKNVTRVFTSVGAEQEYFLVDRDMYEKRLDLKLCGRTIIGGKPPKGQQLDDHYMARIREKVGDFMAALDKELWELGIPAKTKHNEVAPSQHELAPVYEHANIASDHNQMTMELMRTVAEKKGLACLLHEKPFNGVNGSGKHNNFSLATDTGYNLLQPRLFHEDGGLFLIMVCAVLRAVDKYADLIRMAASSASNDHRLGGFEAPPAIVSCFLGEHITSQLLSAANSEPSDSQKAKKGKLSLLPSIPDLGLDDSDRNRTSPMAFTGNKFEFRMLGSSQSVADVNTILNAALADSMCDFAGRLEASSNVSAEIISIIDTTMTEHGRVVFNGNNYSEEWIAEAKKRGLPIIMDAVSAFEAIKNEKNIDLFKRMEIFTKMECLSRYDVLVDKYIETIKIEAETLIHMINRQILPAIVKYSGDLGYSFIQMKKATGIEVASLSKTLKQLCEEIDLISSQIEQLDSKIHDPMVDSDITARANIMRDTVIPLMRDIRKNVDLTETLVDNKYWPIPTYTEILYSV